MQRCLPIVLTLALACTGTGADGDGTHGGSDAGAAAGQTQVGASGSGATAGSSAIGGLTGASGQGQSGALAAGGNAGAAGGAGSSSGGSSGAGGAAALTPARLFPLAVGNKWTFAGPPFSGCSSGEFEETLTSYELHAGRMAYQSVDTCQPSAPVWLSEQDGAIAQSTDTTWAISLAPPIEEGAEWDSSGVRFAWHAVPSVTVPAGTFKDCWKRSLVEHPDAFARTYCPDIGPALDEAAGMRTELTAYAVAP